MVIALQILAMNVMNRPMVVIRLYRDFPDTI